MNLSTRELLSLAALAIIGAVLSAANISLQRILLPLSPPLGLLLVGIAVFTPLLVKQLMPRFATALIAMALAALIIYPFTGAFFPALGMAVIGLLIDLIAHILPARARILRTATLITVLCALLTAVHWQIWNLAALTPELQILSVLALVTGVTLWAMVAEVIAARMKTMNILSGAEDR